MRVNRSIRAGPPRLGRQEAQGVDGTPQNLDLPFWLLSVFLRRARHCRGIRTYRQSRGNVQ